MSKSIVRRSRVQVHFDDSPSLTHQSFKAECDIRNIMHKYKRTGILTHATSAQAIYGDFVDVPDYQESLNIVIDAQNTFDSLPADLRKRFGNDPAHYLSFASDPNNRDEMIKLGMIIPVVVQPDSSKTASEDGATQ